MLKRQPDPGTKGLNTSSSSDTSEDCKRQVEAETESSEIRAMFAMVKEDIVV